MAAAGATQKALTANGSADAAPLSSRWKAIFRPATAS